MQPQFNHEVDKKFYKISRNEILTMRKLKVINNTGFLYLALKYENPFCNRPVEIQVAEFCLKWGMPESSFYAAIAVLRNREAISICNRVVTIQWAETVENSLNHCQQAEPSRNLESILGSENEFSDPRIDIYKDRARGLDLIDSLDPPLPPAGELDGGRKEFSLESEVVEDTAASVGNLSKKLEDGMAAMKGKGFSAAGVEFHQKDISVQTQSAPVEFCQEDILIKNSGAPVEFHQEQIRVSTQDGAVTFHQKHVTVESFPVELETFPRSLLEQAKDLGVTFDQEVIGAIKEHHQSQLMGALKEMEEYSGRINHPNKFLLKKLPKMPKEDLGLRMPLYTSNWLDIPADPLPQDIKERTWQQLRANSAKNKAKKA